MKWVWLIVTAVLASSNSCASVIAPYNTVIKNSGSNKFSRSMVVFDNKEIIAGWVIPGNHKTNRNPSVPITETAIVRWQRENGLVYEKKISLKGKLPTLSDKEEYYFVFDIDDSNDATLKVVVCGPDENCIDKW